VLNLVGGGGRVLLCFQGPFGGGRESSGNQFCFTTTPCLGQSLRSAVGGCPLLQLLFFNSQVIPCIAIVG
jgi:hypothetical protein